MDRQTLFAFSTGAALLVLLGYWHLRGIAAHPRDRGVSHHPPTLQYLFRFLPLAVALLLFLQLSGVIHARLQVSPDIHDTLVMIGQLLFWIGVILAIWARESIGIHWAHAAYFRIIPGQDLVTDGPYAYVRHPIYTALLLTFLGVEVFLVSWLLMCVIPLYILLRWQARKEEELLEEAFGDTYRTYRSRTGAFIPSFRSQ